MSVISLALRSALCLAVVLILGAGAVAWPARADTTDTTPGRVDDGVTTIAVVGDSLAYGIWRSMYSQLQRDEAFDIVRWTEAATGLARPDFFDWTQSIDELLASHAVDLAVVTIGLNDMQALYVDGARSHTLRSDDWDREYRARVERMMDQFLAADVDVFWVGLPIMRSNRFAGNIAHANGIYEAASVGRDVPFIPLWDATTDASGNYASHLPDLRGRTRKMRDNDGIHFTIEGNNLITHTVLAGMTLHVPSLETALAARRR